MKEKIIEGISSNFFGKRFIRFLGKDYVAGNSLETGLRVVDDYYKHGRKSAFNVLGEAATSKKEADRNVRAYRIAIDWFSKKYGKNKVASISVKPTSICAIDGIEILKETPLKTRLGEIVKYAKERNIDVTLDMEDHDWTDRTLKVSQDLWDEGYNNLGIVLQSRLNRTKNDIQKVLKKKYKVHKSKIRVRIVMGVYIEPENIATNNRTEAKKRLVEQVNDLFNLGVYVEIATHDHKILKRIINEIIKPKKISSKRFEFQFLKGVQNAYQIEKELMKQNYCVRYYMPVEIIKFEGVPYMVRRLMHNPDFMKHGIKNTFQKLFIIKK